jgi:hypothetical protein
MGLITLFYWKGRRTRIYKRILNTLLSNENLEAPLYICNELPCQSPFEELFLFKEVQESAWIDYQIQDQERSSLSEDLRKANEYRIFILQLCIEMCK